MSKKTKLAVTLSSALFCLMLAAPAGARGPQGEPMGGPQGGPMGGPQGQLGNQAPKKDPLCLRDCRDKARTCRTLAQQDARMCAESTCSEELQDVKDACDTDPSSDACTAARQAARECLQPCLETLQEALRECYGDIKVCVDACPDRVPPPARDPECVAQCRSDMHDCQRKARDKAKSCRDECSPLLDAAREACSSDSTSSECQDARTALHDCLEPCGQQLGDDMRACPTEARTCLDKCNLSGQE
jgi:hypothetical protein